ncbi:MAG: hypothetical protein WCF12_14095 [Propionicimonas sp.]
MEGANNPTFRHTLTVWPAEPPDLPPVVVHELRRLGDAGDAAEFTSWNPWPQPSPTVELPEDFCLRECLATNPDDLDAVYDFITRWGRLTPPESHLRGPLDALPASLHRLIPTLIDPALRGPLADLDHLAADPDARAGLPHSLHAEAHHLRVLRALVGHTLAADSDLPPIEAWAAEGFRPDATEPWGTFVLTMNAALKPFSVHVRYPGAETLLDTPSTYEVAALQLAKLIAEHRQVRHCANERCTRLFTRQRGRAKYDNTGHSTGVIYCSNLCAKAQAERNRRARNRAQTTIDQDTADA